jgi:hypothetical protein
VVSVTTPSPPYAVSLRRALYNVDPMPVSRPVLRGKLAACIAARPKIGEALDRSMAEIAAATTVEHLTLDRSQGRRRL